MGQIFHTLLTSNTVYDDVGRHNDNYETLRSTFSGTSFPTAPTVGQKCWRTDRGITTNNGQTGREYTYTGDTSIGEDGWIPVEDTGTTTSEVELARGSKLTLDQRLDISLNEDGTLKPNVSLGTEWALAPDTYTYIDATTFTTDTNTSDIFVQYRRVKVNASNEMTFTEVVTSSWDGNITTVTVKDGVLTPQLVNVQHALVSPFRAGNGGSLDFYRREEAAEKNGDSTQKFKVADASTNDEALSKGQLLTEIKAVDGAGSGIDADLLDGHDSSYFLTTTGKAADSDKLDGLDSTKFVRSDVNDAIDGQITLSQELLANGGINTGSGSVTIGGDLTVNGTTTTVNSETLVVDDKNIELGAVDSPTDDTADGGGITLHGDNDKTIIWDKALNVWQFNLGLDIQGDVTLTGTVDGRDIAADGSKLDGIESGATADMTASEILTELKTVDGSGSGLDADKLDGHDSSYFLTTTGKAADSDKLDGLHASSFLRSDITNNAGNQGKFTVENIGTVTDSKPGLLLFAKKYDDTYLNKQGFEGKLFINRGSSGSYNISEMYQIICVTAYNDTKFYLDGSTSHVYLVETTYNSEAWYGAYFPSTSSRNISIMGQLWGTPIFITDASSYTVTKVNGSNSYINQAIVWTSGNDGSGSGLDADKLDGLNTSGGATANTIPVRNGSGDITARLFRSTYDTQTSLADTADVCFRNNTSDNYMRFVDKAGLVSWLGTDLASKTQDVNTSTVYVDKTTGLHYKCYIDDGAWVMEEL